MLKSIVLLSSLSFGAYAQTIVQSIFLQAPSHTTPYVASVVNVASGLTTYAIACTTGGTGCTGEVLTVTEGPSTFAFTTSTATRGITIMVSESCRIEGSTSATCTASGTGVGNGDTDVEARTTTVGSPSGFHYHPVTITAGANKLSPSNGTSATTTSSDNGAAPMVTGMGIAAMGLMGLAALL